MVHWQSEQWRLERRQREEILHHVEQLEDRLDTQAQAFRAKIPTKALQTLWDLKVGEVKGTYDFSKSMIGVGVDAGVFLQKLTTPLGWFDPDLQRQLRQAYDFTLRVERANLKLQFGSLQEKKRILTKAANIAHQVYAQAHKSIVRQWDEAGKTPGKQTELSSRWATRLTLEIGTLFVGVGEAKGAVTAARAVEATELSAATKSAVRGGELGSSTAKGLWAGETAGKEVVSVAKVSGGLVGLPINGATRTVPLGFNSQEQFAKASQQLQDALKASGITDATVGVRGSSVTGSSLVKGTQFGAQSDIDFFIESKQLTEGYTTSSKIPGFVHPNKILSDYPLLQEWSTTWSNNLGRDITPGAFVPGTLPVQPAIVLPLGE